MSNHINSLHQLQQHNLQHQQQMALGNLHQSQQQMQASQQHASDIPPKRQAVVDRLKRRFEIYRKRQNEVAPRFDQTFEQTCEQQSMETNLLQKRFLESKAKRVAKKTEKKQTDSIAGSLQSSVHVQQNFLKRPADESSENLTKFSVEIVQQLEFTTSAADSGQPKQISTNVTVKALTNASVKSDNSGHPSPATPQSQSQSSQNAQHSTNSDLNSNHMASPSPHLQQQNDLDLVGNIVDFKQEPENDFADLKLSDLIGDNTNDESDTFKELISDLSDFHPDSMNLLNFDEKPMIEVKQENIQSDLQSNHQMQHHQMPLDTMGAKANIGSPLNQQQQFPNNFTCQQDSLNKRLPNFNQHNGPTSSMNELSPAAQTLKQMAEQHQHKTAIYQRTNLQQNNNGRSGFTDFNNQFSGNDFNIGQQQPASFHKSGFPGPDIIKQEMMFSQEYDFKRLQQMQQKPLIVNPNGVQNNFTNKTSQQYPQYPQQGSNNLPNHGSPANSFMPNNANANNRNTNGPHNNNNMGHTTLQMKQTQQMHISQHGKPESLSMTQQQGVYFNQQPSQQHSESYSMSQSQTINFTQQSMRQTQQSGTNQTNSSNGSSFGVGRAGTQANEASNINVDLNNSNNTNKSNNFRNSDINSQQQQQAPPGSSAAQMTGLNVPSNQQNAAQNLNENNHSISGNVQLNMSQSQHITSSGMMGVHAGNMLGQTHPQSNMMNIHANQMPVNSNQMQNNNSMPIRSQQEQMKVLQHQQQMMRLQQQQQHQHSLGTMGSRAANSQIHLQHQQALHAQMINQGGRFSNPATMRQIPHKPMPPSGSMYMQNNMGYGQNNINALQTPNVQVGPGGQPIHQQEWRQMVMSQQQNLNYNGNFNSDGFGQTNQHMIQQQLMRSQHQTNINQNQMQHILHQGNQMNSIHMSQTQNIVNNFQTNQQGANTNESASVMQNNDFSLEFLDLPDGAQDLLNSLENESFNIQDML